MNAPIPLCLKGAPMPLDCANLSRVTHMRVGDRLYPIDSYEQASTMFLAALDAWDGPQHAVPDPALCDEDGHERVCQPQRTLLDRPSRGLPRHLRVHALSEGARFGLAPMR